MGNTFAQPELGHLGMHSVPDRKQMRYALVVSSHKHQYLQPRGLIPNKDGAKFQTDALRAMARAVDRDPGYQCNLCPVPLEGNRDAVPRAGLDPQMARLQKR